MGIFLKNFWAFLSTLCQTGETFANAGLHMAEGTRLVAADWEDQCKFDLELAAVARKAALAESMSQAK